MINFLKNFFDKYFYDDEQYAALFILSIGIVILYFLGGIIAPVLVSILIAYILNGLMSFMEEKGNSRILALSVTLFIFGLFYLSIFLFLPFLSRQILLLVSDIPQIYESVNTFLSNQLAQYELQSNQLDEVIINAFSYVPTLFQNALLQLNSGFSAVMNALLYLIIVPFLVFFLLKDRDIFINHAKDLLPKKKNLLTKIWNDLNIQLYGYLRGKGLEMIIVALVTGFVFYFQEVNYSIILSILVGLSVLIPYVGAILVTIPVVLIGLFQWGLDSSFYIFITSYLIIQALDGNVLMPLLLGREVKLHPVIIITAVLIFGGIWGFWGLLLAIPIATFLRAIMLAWPTREDLIN
ncbi:MAG: AI-2E family transporter [SAR86 cluster bacterium]|uniref:AI-2E family transporter n=1 Tax=SAR86 cluster bacterium TaxID=2030880 RepID=A0A937I771_9GAMM|nr:AI-2E family transporter [Gammaproteobacteria bacterium]MBL6811661.1 AI-2E family transporter [SAR86 cluster bacterium]|tara:strand:- start:431 stop:1483 length:1053 start_codon:yes stop_codon:yes gene_type:complete